MAFDQGSVSSGSKVSETMTNTRLEIKGPAKCVSKLQKELDAMKGEKSATGAVPSGSGHEGPPPNPSKTSGEMKNSCLEHTLLTDQADDASDFIDWSKMPQDACERIKAREDREQFRNFVRNLPTPLRDL